MGNLTAEPELNCPAKGSAVVNASLANNEERPHLQPLPASLFPCFQEARRSVHRDSYVEVERAFYEAPPEPLGLSFSQSLDLHRSVVSPEGLRPWKDG